MLTCKWSWITTITPSTLSTTPDTTEDQLTQWGVIHHWRQNHQPKVDVHATSQELIQRQYYRMRRRASIQLLRVHPVLVPWKRDHFYMNAAIINHTGYKRSAGTRTRWEQGNLRTPPTRAELSGNFLTGGVVGCRSFLQVKRTCAATPVALITLHFYCCLTKFDFKLGDFATNAAACPAERHCDVTVESHDRT